MEVIWNKNLRSTSGRCRSGKDRETGRLKCSIELAPHILDTGARLRDTFLHELIHAANWLIDRDRNAAHGPAFKAWGYKAIQIHPELPPVSTKHSYEINFKYWWECENVQNNWCDVKVTVFFFEVRLLWVSPLRIAKIHICQHVITIKMQVGRKTNSLHVDRVRCAKCKGKFVYVRFKYHDKERKLKIWSSHKTALLWYIPQ